jgi:putative membrane protein
MKFIARFLLSVLGLLVIAQYVPGISLEGVYVATISVLILGLLNAIVRPVLFILTLPITIITLGLFSFVINAALFWFVASFVDGFTVDSFGIALLVSLLMTVINMLGSNWIK